MKQAPSSKLLFTEAERRGYHPEWLTEYGWFVFTVNGREAYGYQTKNFGNNQFATWLSDDKYAARLLMDRLQLPNIPYLFTEELTAVETFFDCYHRVIAKPVLGLQAKDVVLVTEKQQLASFELSTTIWEQYIPGVELRYFLVKGEVVAVQQQPLQPLPDRPWHKHRINLAENDWNSEMMAMATKIQQQLRQAVLAVDFIQDEQGKVWLLELNSMPGLWPLANPHQGEPINLAPMVLDVLIETQLSS